VPGAAATTTVMPGWGAAPSEPRCEEGAGGDGRATGGDGSARPRSAGLVSVQLFGRTCAVLRCWFGRWVPQVRLHRRAARGLLWAKQLERCPRAVEGALRTPPVRRCLSRAGVPPRRLPWPSTASLRDLKDSREVLGVSGELDGEFQFSAGLQRRDAWEASKEQSPWILMQWFQAYSDQDVSISGFLLFYLIQFLLLPKSGCWWSAVELPGKQQAAGAECVYGNGSLCLWSWKYRTWMKQRIFL